MNCRSMLTAWVDHQKHGFLLEVQRNRSVNVSPVMSVGKVCKDTNSNIKGFRRNPRNSSHWTWRMETLMHG
jgi:hypothetical protein